MTQDDVQWRVQFDAEVTFANGGGLQAREFRLDAAGPDIGDAELGDLFVRHLGLLMVDGVAITNKRMLREAHKGSRGTGSSGRRPAGARVVDLSHRITSTRLDSGTTSLPLARVADLEGVLVRATGSAGRAIDRKTLLPHDVAGRAVLVHTDGDHHFLTAEAADWLVAQQAALVGIDALDVDDVEDPGEAGGVRPARAALSAAGIPVVVHLRGLSQLPPSGFRFHAALPAGEGAGTFAVRAYAVLEQS